MHGWQANKKRTCTLPEVKGYARKCKTTGCAGGYLFVALAKPPSETGGIKIFRSKKPLFDIIPDKRMICIRSLQFTQEDKESAEGEG